MIRIILLLFLCQHAASQCFTVPTGTEYPITANNPVQNVSFLDNTIFKGQGVIKASVSFLDWDWLVFSGQIAVQANLTFKPGEGKIYASGATSFNRIAFNGSDTIFVNSLTSISAIDNAGSLNNTIILGSNINYILIGNKIYKPGDTVNGVQIIKCTGGGALPLKPVSFKVKKIGANTYQANFEVLETDGTRAKKYTIYLTDTYGKNHVITTILPNSTGKYVTTFTLK